MHASAEQQLDFIAYLQRIIVEGDFVATYKFALLHAIADICIERPVQILDEGASRQISIDELAIKFVELYWRHSLPYSASGSTPQLLRQSSGRQAGVLSQLASLRELGVSSVTELRRHSDWGLLLTKVRRIIIDGPLWRLQMLGGETVCHLYPHDKGSDYIRLSPGTLFCMRRFYDLVVSFVRNNWLQKIREFKGNRELIGQEAGLEDFLFGTNRRALGKIGKVLEEIQAGACFYCGKAINVGGEVDHFIPWRRYPMDLGHNFVLAHGNCNRSKRDFLAAPEHRDAWYEQNILNHGALLDEYLTPLVSVDVKRSVAITAWAYQHAARERTRLWRGIDEFVDATGLV